MRRFIRYLVDEDEKKEDDTGEVEEEKGDGGIKIREKIDNQ
jgi:hypothetical protein